MRHEKAVWRVKVAACAVLALSVLLPLYSLPVAFDEAVREYSYPATIALGDWEAAIPLAVAYFWPVLLLVASGRVRSSAPALLVRIAELLLPVASTIVVAMIPALVFEFREFIPFLLWFVPVTARPALGCWVAVAANAVYLTACLVDMTVVALATPRVREA